MNSMDERWNHCARAARGAEKEAPPPVPHGFAQRALRSAHAAAENAALDLWAALSRRALACAAAAFMLAASLLWWQEPGDGIAPPALADEAIEQALWQP